MKIYYCLRIKATQEQSDKITPILGIEPTYSEDEWSYEKVITKNDPYINYIDLFLDILKDKYDELEDIGITRDRISVWIIYAYEEQCNMEFWPKDLKNLGENGIVLCISCYEEFTRVIQ